MIGLRRRFRRVRPDVLILCAVLVASGFMYSAPAPQSGPAIPAVGLGPSLVGIEASVSPASGTPDHSGAPATLAATPFAAEATAGSIPATATGAPQPSPSASPPVPSPAPTPAPKAPQRVRKAAETATAAQESRRATVAPRTAPQPFTRPLAPPGGVVRGLRGGASYYGTGGPGKYGAMHEYRDGTRVVVVVTSFHDGHTYSVTVPIVTQCGACRFRSGETLVDLSVPAWLELGWPLSRGIAPVTVTILEGSLR